MPKIRNRDPWKANNSSTAPDEGSFQNLNTNNKKKTTERYVRKIKIAIVFGHPIGEWPEVVVHKRSFFLDDTKEVFHYLDDTLRRKKIQRIIRDQVKSKKSTREKNIVDSRRQ